MSVIGSVPTTVAFLVVPSLKLTEMDPLSPTPETTWLLVRILPSLLSTMPEPEPEPDCPLTLTLTTDREHRVGHLLDGAVLDGGGLGGLEVSRACRRCWCTESSLNAWKAAAPPTPAAPPRTSAPTRTAAVSPRARAGAGRGRCRPAGGPGGAVERADHGGKRVGVPGGVGRDRARVLVVRTTGVVTPAELRPGFAAGVLVRVLVGVAVLLVHGASLRIDPESDLWIGYDRAKTSGGAIVPGTWNQKAAPPPGAPPARASPPWRSATALTIERPSPEPGMPRDSAER